MILLMGADARAQGERPAVVEWTPDGKIFIAARGLLARFDLTSDQEELLDTSGLTFALSADGTRLALAGGARLEVRRYPSLEVEWTLESNDGDLEAPPEFVALAFSPSGATLAAGTRDGRVLLWDLEDGELWAELGVETPSQVDRLGFAANGALLTAFADGRALLWDIEKREMLQQIDLLVAEGRPGPVTSVVALSSDGRYVLANQVRDADADVFVLDAHAGGLGAAVVWRRAGYGIEFTRDGAGVLVLAPPFRIAALYRAETGEPLQVFEPPEGVATLYLVRQSPDGTRLLGVGEGLEGQVLIVWDFATARILQTRR
jgi:WD40 repeat protein